jgi:hypothetical protein
MDRDRLFFHALPWPILEKSLKYFSPRQETFRTSGVAKSVVDEFNKSWAEHLGYHVELVGWEDTASGFGHPQDIINQDLERCELLAE